MRCILEILLCDSTRRKYSSAIAGAWLGVNQRLGCRLGRWTFRPRAPPNQSHAWNSLRRSTKRKRWQVALNRWALRSASWHVQTLTKNVPYCLPVPASKSGSQYRYPCEHCQTAGTERVFLSVLLLLMRDKLLPHCLSLLRIKRRTWVISLVDSASARSS